MNPKDVTISQMNLCQLGCTIELIKIIPDKFFGPKDAAHLDIDIYFTVKPILSLLFNNLILNFSKIKYDFSLSFHELE